MRPIKRQQSLRTNDRDRALICEVVRALNQQDAPAQSTAAEAATPERPRARTKQEQLLIAEMVRDAASEGVREQWRQWWLSERVHFGRDIRGLAAGGRVRREVLMEAAEHVKKLARVEVAVEVRAGQARIQYLPRFSNWLAACSYALLRLSMKDIRVGLCRRCEKLFLVDDRPGRGRRREHFCSAAHRNAYAQAKWRVDHPNG